MRKLLLLLTISVSVLLMNCKGEQGPAGPQGPAGSTGSAGATGPQGPIGVPGKDASAPTIIDFTVDLSKPLPQYDLAKKLDPLDIPIVYILINKGSGYTMLPYRGFAYTADQKDFMRLDVYAINYESYLALYNAFTLPPGSTFVFRAAIFKGAKGGRVDLSRYQNYENLKGDFNLKD